VRRARLEHHIDRIDDAWDRVEPIVWGGGVNQELRDRTPEREAAGYRLPARSPGTCAAAGVSLEQWIIDQRLECARTALASPAGGIGPSPAQPWPV
jgi:hypothetical protein